jgi:hypothetical protein
MGSCIVRAVRGMNFQAKNFTGGTMEPPMRNAAPREPRCIVCREVMAAVLARLGSTTCHDCRAKVAHS